MNSTSHISDNTNDHEDMHAISKLSYIKSLIDQLKNRVDENFGKELEGNKMNEGC